MARVCGLTILTQPMANVKNSSSNRRFLPVKQNYITDYSRYNPKDHHSPLGENEKFLRFYYL